MQHVIQLIDYDKQDINLEEMVRTLRNIGTKAKQLLSDKEKFNKYFGCRRIEFCLKENVILSDK